MEKDREMGEVRGPENWREKRRPRWGESGGDLEETLAA